MGVIGRTSRRRGRPALRAVLDVDASTMDALTGKMIRFLETGDTPEGLFRRTCSST